MNLSIQLLTCAGEFYEPARQVQDFQEIVQDLHVGMNLLFETEVDSIVEVLHAFSRSLVRDKDVRRIEGIAFLSNWLRRDNLLRIIDVNLGDKKFLDHFQGGDRKLRRAFPRGLVCHWMAGNIPTLALFSLFQSMLAKNGNVIRVPEVSLPTVLPILRLFSETRANGVTGSDLLKSVAVAYFPSAETQYNVAMSTIADARVIWGGKEAVEAIIGLPHATHCEDVIFGPKYSFAVIDRAALASEKLPQYIRNLATDSILFEQTACSSPHVIFVETDWDGLKSLGQLLSKELSRLSKRIPKQFLDTGTGIAIINRRAEYALSEDKELLATPANDWSILLDHEIQLEEPIQSRTIFLKSLESVLETIPLVTRNVQTVGTCILDREKAKRFAEGVMLRGVARCVPPGQMHIYDSPWDGILLISRLVRWNTLTLMSEVDRESKV